MTEKVSSSEKDHIPEAGPFPGRRWFKKFLAVMFSCLVLSILVGYQYLNSAFNRPSNPRTNKTTRIRIRPGTSFGNTLKLLEENGLIQNPVLFHLQARLRGGTKNIQAGVYGLKASMSPREIYEHLLEGKVIQQTFTIPEGYNIREIAATIRQANLAGEDEILRLSRSPSFLRELSISADSLEGYLFPDTYRFPVGTTAKRILRFMVLTMRKKFTPDMKKRAKLMGFTIHQTLTLASIIEKETSLIGERRVIAAVFLNRLKQRMRLQSDPTVIYGLPHFDGNITKKDLRYDSPYNTYLYRGLPPGPIASPGIASIQSALNPAKVKYLYFVANKKGGHQFSRTYREHRRAVNRYQRRQK